MSSSLSRRRVLLAFALALIGVAFLAPALTFAADTSAAPRVADAKRWQARVDRYLTIRDKANPPPTDGVVFTGSSSIDMWVTLKADFPHLSVVNRGIGGTWLADQLQIAPQLVYPLEPSVIVLYAGENDLHAGRTADDVVIAFEQVRDQIHATAPAVPIVFLALKPSPSRLALLAAMRDANTRIAALCAKDPLCTFVDVFTPMLDTKGNPRAELFSEDNLHMSPEGYRLWTELVAPVLRHLSP